MRGIIHHLSRWRYAGVPAQWIIFVFAAVGAEPQPLAHWVQLTDGSLLVGRIENIDGEQLHIDLRLEKETVVAVPRRCVVSIIVIPPVDPALAEKLLSSLEDETADTIRLVDGKTLSGRLRNFSKGVFRFDLSFGGFDELLLESQPIPWRRVRAIYLAFNEKIQKNGAGDTVFFLKNGSKIVSTGCENRENGTALVRNSCFVALELPLSSLISRYAEPLE